MAPPLWPNSIWANGHSYPKTHDWAIILKLKVEWANNLKYNSPMATVYLYRSISTPTMDKLSSNFVQRPIIMNNQSMESQVRPLTPPVPYSLALRTDDNTYHSFIHHPR